MSTSSYRLQAGNKNKGIALVIVLGLMALLMILAVGFFVAMRTERLAARSYADMARARQMVNAGIARAVEEIDLDIGDKAYPQWNAKISDGGLPITPMFAPFMSPLISPTTTQYPTNLLDQVPAFMQGEVLAVIPNVTWKNIEKPATTLSYNPRTLFGRFAYIAVNVSGFIDPNRDYNPTNNTVFRRYDGYGPNEIAYNHPEMPLILNELTNTTAAASLFTARSPGGGRTKSYYRAENLVDLYMVGRFPSSYYTSGVPLARTPINMYPYSYFPLGYRDATGNAQTNIYIGGTADDVEKLRPQITAAFAAMPGVSPSDPNGLARGIVDYLDNDFVPGGVGGGGLASGANCDMVCNEAVPMLHQIHINTNISPSSSVSRAAVQIIAQVWYPFVAPTNTLSYQVKMDVSVEGNGYSPSGSTTATLNLTTPAGGWMAHRYGSCTNTFWFETSNTNAIPTSLTVKELSVLQGSMVVDRACGPGSATPVVIPWTTFFADTLGPVVGSFWWAPDPRLNWRWTPTTDDQWVRGGPKGAIGPNWGSYHPGVQGEFGSREMYIRNQGQIRSVGELGLLAYEGLPGTRALGQWKTISLVGPEALPVLDRFSVYTNALAGIVNPNSRDDRPIAAMFLNAPFERWPGESTNRIDGVMATAFAGAIQKQSGMYTNLSDLARLDVSVLPSTLNPLLIEGAIRDTAQLFSTRQQLFLLFVRGQSVADTSGTGPNWVTDEAIGEVRGDAMAIALVWRDPHKVNGRHRTFVRWIKWVNQ